MKLLVMSDSHRRKNILSSIIADNIDADAFIFLGDGLNDFDDALAENGIDPCDMKKDVAAVPGNCDFFGRMEGRSHIVRNFGGINFYITHGAEENVKLGVWTLVENASASGCKVALYGHTHYQSCMEKNGVTVFNPGAVEQGEYGIVMIKDNKAEFICKVCT